MIRSSFSIALIPVFLAPWLDARSQCTCPPCPLVDITLVDDGANTLEVRLRPDGQFNELVSQLQFTIRWDASSGASLDNIVQLPPALIYMPLGKWGTEVDDAGYRYQIFGGLGFTSIGAAGGNWNAGIEYTLMTVPVILGSSTFEIVNDTWTAANNADYFVSLCGTDQTGAIYLTPTGIVGPSEGPVSILPNPTTGTTWLSMDVDGASDVRLEVISATGQLAWSKEIKGFSGQLREPIDLSRAGAGVYMLSIESDGTRSTHRLVVR